MTTSALVSVLVVLLIVGVVLWAINQYVPMQPPFKTILNVAVLIVALLWLLKTFSVI